MRLKASHRRRLEELLSIAGSPAIAVALPWVQHWRDVGSVESLGSLSRAAPRAVVEAIEAAATLKTDDNFADCRHAYLLEELLTVSQSAARQRRGVYFTPVEIVRYIVQAVDRALREHLGLVDGLASSGARILDPAAGSGVFLAEAIRVIHAQASSAWHARGYSPDEILVQWSEYVPREILPRLTGWEIMAEGVIAAHCLLVETLRQTGYAFRDGVQLQVEQRDALAPAEELRFNVVLGNPPYASLSTAAHGWIEGLIQSPDDGYMTVNGEPLGETKHWLHDDYVKFLRLAQWHVQQYGSGVAGMITNHGYLENTSFRGMRASLLNTFPRIEIVDLHGNAKMRERSPDGARDDSVFGITSGAAIGIFVRPPTPPAPAQVHRADMWGSRAEKLQRLTSPEPVAPTVFTPVGPQYRFSPQERKTPRAYERAWRLCDTMPLSTTAPVTARDSFVVAFTREELVERMEVFCDLSVSDDVVRSRFFTNTRSSKYAPGDARAWKLSQARRKLAADPAWRDCLRLCQYRPLDYRWVLWHRALVDWPRREVLRHLLEHENVALIARRQSPTGLPADFFWATQTLALDGVIRSDNRGSESLFPLWRYDEGVPQANFAGEFIPACERALGTELVHRYEALSGASQPLDFTPLALVGYIYGLFWSAGYRTRYQRELSSDFPRILLPRDMNAFLALSRQGLQLLRRHTRVPATERCPALSGNWIVAAGFPHWRDGQVWINPQTSIGESSLEAWECRIGAHQVARKWLKDRRGRQLRPAEIAAYRSLAAVLASNAEHLK
jgi:predicted helicase